MAAQDCLDAVRSAFGGTRQFSDEDIEFVLEEIIRRNDEQAGRFDTTTEAFMDAAREVAEEVQIAARINRRNTRLTIRARRRFLSLAQESRDLYGNPFLAVTAVLMGSEKPLRGGLRSVHNIHQGIFYKHAGGMVADLERGDLLTDFNSGHLDREIARGLEAITKEGAPGTRKKAAKQIAEIIHKHRKALFDLQNRKGSWVGQLTGRITTQGHELSRIRKAGFDKWRDFIFPRLDHERTFKGRDPDRFLLEAYKTIIAGKDSTSKGAEIDLAVQFIGKGALASRLSNRHRVLHFVDADKWTEYNNQFGTRSFRESIIFEMNTMARNTALMDVLGPVPHDTFEKIIRIVSDEEIAAGRPVSKTLLKFARAGMQVADGTAAAPDNITAANWGQGIRVVGSMARLGGATASGIADVGFTMAEIRRLQGGGIIHPFTQTIVNFFDGFATKEKRILGESLGVGLEGMIGDIAQRVSSAESRMSVGNRALRMFFKLNLLTPWTDTNKRGMGFFTANYLAQHSNMNFVDLPDQLPFIMRQFDIDERHWPVLREAIETVSDGRRMMLPEKIGEVPDELFIRQGLDPVEDREALEIAYRAFLIDTVDTAIPTPGIRERTILTGGLPPGSVLGEGLRFMGQFKSFPITVMTRNVARRLFNNPDGRADIQGFAIMIASTTLLGYVAKSVKDIARGREPRDFFDGQTLIASMLQGGGMGLLGDFALGETNRFGRSFLDTLAGPTLGTISDLDELRAKLMFGDKSASTALRIAITNTPYLNLIYTRMALDYLILYHLQEMANPGYLRRAERRLEREQGQSYIFPPSRVIPRGGDLLRQR